MTNNSKNIYISIVLFKWSLNACFFLAFFPFLNNRGMFFQRILQQQQMYFIIILGSYFKVQIYLLLISIVCLILKYWDFFVQIYKWGIFLGWYWPTSLKLKHIFHNFFCLMKPFHLTQKIRIKCTIINKCYCLFSEFNDVV